MLATLATTEYVTTLERAGTAQRLVRRLEPIKTCANEGLFELFRQDAKLCFMDPRLIPGGSLHNLSGALFKDLDDPENRFRLLLAHEVKYLGDSNAMHERATISALRRTIEGFSNEALTALPPTLFVILPFLSTQQTRHVNSLLVENFIKAQQHSADANFDPIWVGTLNRLHDSVIKEHLGLIQRTLANGCHRLPLHGFRDGIIKGLLAEEEYCSTSHPGHIIGLGEKQAKAGLLSAECFAAAAARFKDTDCRRALRYLPPKITADMTEGLPPRCLRLLTKEQVAAYGKLHASDGDRCKSLDITKLTATAISGITDDCLVGRYTSSELSEPILLKYAWRVIPPTHLSRFVERPDALDRVAKDDWGYMTLPQKQVLVDAPDLCEQLPVDFFLRRGGVNVGRECFEKMSGPVQAVAFLFAHLPNDALASLDSLDEWETPPLGADSEGAKGFAVLELGGGLVNIDRLISGLSATASRHACSKIADKEELEKYPLLKAFASEACIAALGA